MSQHFFSGKTKKAIFSVVLDYKAKREKAIERLGLSEEEYKKEVAATREKPFNRFDENLQVARKNMERNGFIIHEAEDSNEARLVLKDILGGKAVIAKSKTNTGREIDINSALKDLEYCETDLGDAIVQLFKEKDQHYVLPAIHITPQKIQEAIQKQYGKQVSDDPEELTHFLCGKIRENILKANVGITGANFFTKTGQIVLLENEGNISLVSRLPHKHIVIVGIDKLVETIEDATQLCRTAAIFGTGQDITQYISVISGPSKTADIGNTLVQGAQGAKEVHIILLDNKRRKMMENGFGDLLKCINCGACINFCPVYHQVGSAYGGSKYIGSKGIVTSAFMETLLKAKENGSFDCTLCGNCHENCPMDIDLSEMIRKVRILQNKNGIQTDANKEALNNVEKHGNPFGEVSEDEIPDKLHCC